MEAMCQWAACLARPQVSNLNLKRSLRQSQWVQWIARKIWALSKEEVAGERG